MYCIGGGRGPSIPQSLHKYVYQALTRMVKFGGGGVDNIW